jgi:hypothetical protein
MPIQFVPHTISFRRIEGSQPESATLTGFAAPIKAAQVVLQGFRFDFEGVVEHPIDKVQVQVGFDGPPPIGATVAVVRALVDYSGKPTSDFEYNVDVNLVVIAEV